MRSRDLNPRQRAFADFVLRGEPAYKAYTLAGYTAKNSATARASSSQLLATPNVAAYLAEKRDKISEKLEMDATWVLRRLRENLERALQAEPVRDADGNPTGDYTYQGAVANKSLELIGKQLGMFVERKDITVHATLAGLIEEACSEDEP